jgi:hypothetical protein
MKQFKFILLTIALMISFAGKSQTEDAKTVDNYFELINYWKTVTPSKEAKFSPYIEAKYSFTQNFTTWKQENRFLYIKEIWYHAESFYVLHNKSTEGVKLDESIIDISRFESYRKQNEETIINLPGFKDAIVLLPSSSLIYKP